MSYKKHLKNYLVLVSVVALASSPAIAHGNNDHDHKNDGNQLRTLTVSPEPSTSSQEIQAPAPLTTEQEPTIDHPFYLRLDDAISSPSVKMFTDQDTKEVTEQKIKEFDTQLATLSPTILYYAANNLITKGYNEKAATYYVMAELRQNFDKRRFTIDKKSAGYFAQEKVGKTAYYRINPWLSHSADRMIAIYEKVKYLDTITPVQYHPGYNVLDESNPEKWPQIHEQTRQDYFRKFDEYLIQIKQYNKAR